MADVEGIKTPFGIFWLLSIGFLWLFWAIMPGNVFVWLWIAGLWTLIGFILLLGLILISRRK